MLSRSRQKRSTEPGSDFKVYTNELAAMEAPQWQGGSTRQTRTTFLADRATELGRNTTRTPRPNEEYITALRKGNVMLKYGRRGQPHAAHFMVDKDMTRLSWKSKKARKADGYREILFTDVKAVESGQGTPVFKRFPAHEHLKTKSFSIIYEKKGRPRTLDIVCKDADEYELWFVGLDSVHRGQIQPVRPQQQPHRKPHHKGGRRSTGPALEVGRDGSEPLLGGSESGQEDGPASPKVSSDSLSKKPLEVVSPNKKKKKKKAVLEPAKDLIGDIYIWGAPSGAISSGRSAQGAPAVDGLQESWAPTVVNDTFRLDVASVACGPRHAVLVTKNGETYTWGCGDAGRLGHGDCQALSQPKMVLDLSGRGVMQMACGDWHSAAVTRDGSLYTWGDGTAGILGHGNPHRLWSPKRVERPLQGVIFTFVAAGPYHTAAVSRTGDLYTWGDGFGGKLGHGGQDTYLQPRKVEKLSGHRVSCVACGVWHTACVTLEPAPEPQQCETSSSTNPSEGAADQQQQPRRRRGAPRDRGVVWTWGGGDKGCLGNGDDEGRIEPERVKGGPESVRSVAAGLHFTLILSKGSKVWLTGTTFASGYDGQKLPPWEGGLVPMRVKGPLGGLIATQIAAGMHHVAVIAGPIDNPSSRLYTWGRGTEGQLGHGPAVPGSSPSCPEPRLICSLENRRIIQVACGGCNTMAVVEHDAKANLHDYDLVTKELDGLLPSKSRTAPPAGLMISHLPSLGEGPGSGAGSAGRRRSRTPSVAQSIASGITGRRGPDSDGGRTDRRDRASSSAAPWGGVGPLALPPSGALGGPPAIFLCPITREVFEDPVVAADGYTYERASIVQWLRNKPISPMTNMKLDHMSLTTNHAVRSAIDEWRQWSRATGQQGGRTHRYAHSIGGSSQGSIFSGPHQPPTSHHGGAFHGAVIMASNPLGGPTSVRSASTAASMDPLRGISERL